MASGKRFFFFLKFWIFHHQHSLAAEDEATAVAGNSTTDAELPWCSIELQWPLLGVRPPPLLMLSNSSRFIARRRFDMNHSRAKHLRKFSDNTPYRMGLTTVLSSANSRPKIKWCDRRKKPVSSVSRLPSTYIKHITTVIGNHITSTTITLISNTRTTRTCFLYLSSSCRTNTYTTEKDKTKIK